jgi:hypothetical protein
MTTQEIKVLWCDILLVFIDELFHDARNTKCKIYQNCICPRDKYDLILQKYEKILLKTAASFSHKLGYILRRYILYIDNFVDLNVSGSLRSADWQLFSDVSVQNISCIRSSIILYHLPQCVLKVYKYLKLR